MKVYFGLLLILCISILSFSCEEKSKKDIDSIKKEDIRPKRVPAKDSKTKSIMQDTLRPKIA